MIIEKKNESWKYQDFETHETRNSHQIQKKQSHKTSIVRFF